MTQTLDAWPAGATATMNVTYTQANAAGGAVVCEITPGAGNEFIVMNASAINSGTNGVVIDNATVAGGTEIGRIISVGSGAGTTARIGLNTASVITTGGAGGVGWPCIISGTQALRFAQTAAGAQNDTFHILLNIRCKGAVPTVTHANSTNPANVTVTAGAESFATV